MVTTSRTAGLDAHDSNEPRQSFSVATWLFLRLLGLCYLCAFWSFAAQARGLVGHDGILPADQFMASARQWADGIGLGATRYLELPTLCWLNSSDGFLVALSVAGALLALLLTAGIGSVVVTPILFTLYLSLSVVARDFLAFQWDALLLETGLLAIFVAPLALVDRPGSHEPQPLARLLLWWLLFRLMFGSGLVKLTSGDPTWRHLTALAFHYETQPLPTPLAWWAHLLPLGFHRMCTGATLATELIAPWLIWAGRRARLVACALFVSLQALIALTGNYAFFNLLTVALSLTLVDDGAFRRPVQQVERRSRRWALPVVAVAALATVPLSLRILGSQAGFRVPGSDLIAPLQAAMRPLRSVNPYGLFAVMTTRRPEILVEGSTDGATWRPYEFRYKPGPLDRALPWAAPHQPRLDWQMWFAALGDPQEQQWFVPFCQRLLEGSPAVLGLLARNPFPDEAPMFIRATLSDYRFTDLATRRATGRVWSREELGPYLEPLGAPDRRARPLPTP